MNLIIKAVAPRYGMLTVLGHESGLGWRVRCECGTEKHYDGGALRSGTYNSCGCARHSRRRYSTRPRDPRSSSGINLHLRPLRHAQTGTRCWVCRNRTGTKALVALCYVCRGDA